MQHYSQPKIKIGEILKDAFRYWNQTLILQFFFSLFYFSIIFLLGYYFFKYFGLNEDFYKLTEIFRKDPDFFRSESEALALTPGFRNFAMVMVFIKALMYPLNIGFYKIYRKIDLKEPVTVNDLFIGFQGFNFFKFASFAVFWGFIFLYANSMIPLSVIWVLITLFSAPLMFFMDKNISECIRLTVKGLRIYFVEIVACSLVAFLFSYCGVLLFGFGILFTFPFWNAMIYSLYKVIFREVEEKV